MYRRLRKRQPSQPKKRRPEPTKSHVLLKHFEQKKADEKMSEVYTRNQAEVYTRNQAEVHTRNQAEVYTRAPAEILADTKSASEPKKCCTHATISNNECIQLVRAHRDIVDHIYKYELEWLGRDLQMIIGGTLSWEQYIDIIYSGTGVSQIDHVLLIQMTCLHNVDRELIKVYVQNRDEEWFTTYMNDHLENLVLCSNNLKKRLYRPDVFYPWSKVVDILPKDPINWTNWSNVLAHEVKAMSIRSKLRGGIVGRDHGDGLPVDPKHLFYFLLLSDFKYDEKQLVNLMHTLGSGHAPLLNYIKRRYTMWKTYFNRTYGQLSTETDWKHDDIRLYLRANCGPLLKTFQSQDLKPHYEFLARKIGTLRIPFEFFSNFSE